MPGHHAPVGATRSPLVRLLGSGPPRVTLAGGVLHLGDEDAIPAGSVDHVATRRSWFWTRLEVRAPGRGSRSVGGLRRRVEPDGRAMLLSRRATEFRSCPPARDGTMWRGGA